MKTILNVTLPLLACTFAALCQDAAKPIPAEWLHDGRLVVAQLNFSVSSPPNVQWSYSVGPYNGSKVTTLTGIDASNVTVMPYIVVVVDRQFADLGSRKSFVEEMQKGLPGWKVQDVQYEQTDIPISGSARFRTKWDAPGEPFGIAGRVTLYQYGYVLSGKYSYILFCGTPEAAEPAHFSRFAASFALISPTAGTGQPQTSNYTGAVIGTVLFGLWLLMRIMKNRQKHGSGQVY